MCCWHRTRAGPGDPTRCPRIRISVDKGQVSSICGLMTSLFSYGLMFALLGKRRLSLAVGQVVDAKKVTARGSRGNGRYLAACLRDMFVSCSQDLVCRKRHSPDQRPGLKRARTSTPDDGQAPNFVGALWWLMVRVDGGWGRQRGPASCPSSSEARAARGCRGRGLGARQVAVGRGKYLCCRA